jgi:hypothetical protein
MISQDGGDQSHDWLFNDSLTSLQDDWRRMIW